MYAKRISIQKSENPQGCSHLTMSVAGRAVPRNDVVGQTIPQNAAQGFAGECMLLDGINNCLEPLSYSLRTLSSLDDFHPPVPSAVAESTQQCLLADLFHAGKQIQIY
jgi:hypothetical protein